MTQHELEITAPIFNIQTYCIHDGPGIRTTVFVKGCPLHCIWCQNPESNTAKAQLMTYSSKCTGCGKCVAICKNNAIYVSPDNTTSITDRSKCRDCGECVEACQVEARELVGKLTTVQAALNAILEDKIFYKASGGGMTISGGEVLLYPEFSANLYKACKEHGISTAIETCCYAKRDVINKVFENVDIALLDLKHMDSKKHLELTGVNNEIILENIEHIYHLLKKDIIIRIPIIPSCNDDKENISRSARFVSEKLSKSVKIHLLPYHNLGNSKNENLGKNSTFNAVPPTAEYMNTLSTIVEGYGIECQIGGS